MHSTTTTERKKAREAEKILARREHRATYDLPPDVRNQIKALAEAQRLPASQLVTLALLQFINAFEAGEIQLGEYKQPSRSPRYDWNLIFPEELFAVLQKNRNGGQSNEHS